MKQHKFKPYCIMCGNPTKSETCSDECRVKLRKLHNAIDNRIVMEKMGAKQYDERTIRDFNKIQDIIG